MTLHTQHCVPCRGKEGLLSPQLRDEYVQQLVQWQLHDEDRCIFREFRFKNYREAEAFVLKVGELAEAEGHHPDIAFGWGYARFTLSTHDAGGLTANDMILAAKIDTLA